MLCQGTLTLQAQKIQGIATYKTAMNVQLQMDSSRLSNTDQAAMQKQLAKAMQQEFTLNFNLSESSYAQVESLGDAPTAVMESIRLIKEQQWQPQLIIGLPVGFVGTVECKDALRQIEKIHYITNFGNRGGSPWAAAAMNALMIQAVNRQAGIRGLP